MKSFLLPILAGIAAASPLQLTERENPLCVTPGTRGAVPAESAGGPKPYLTVPGKGNLEACRALCFSGANAKCRSFAIRENASSGGACQLYDFDISASVIPRDTTTYVYYPLPAGIVGWVPENVAKHYKAINEKAAGNYVACRQLCLNDAGVCKGFGYKQDAKCQLYDVSLSGKVKADSTSPYIQWPLDCAFSS